MDVKAIAKVCHEANRAYCAALGDNSQPSWESAPAWQQESAINGVKHAHDSPAAAPADSHESWLAEKRAAGWKYGPLKDPEKKEHPCFVPYEQLPDEQKQKDFLFLAIVRALRGGPSSLPAETSSPAAIEEYPLGNDLLAKS